MDTGTIALIIIGIVGVVYVLGLLVSWLISGYHFDHK